MVLDVVECDGCEQHVEVGHAEEYILGDRKGYICSFCSDEPATVSDKQSDEEPLWVQTWAAFTLVCIGIPILSLLLLPFITSPLTFWQGLSLLIIGFISAGLLIFVVEDEDV